MPDDDYATFIPEPGPTPSKEMDVDAQMWTGYTPTPPVEEVVEDLNDLEEPWNAPRPQIPTFRPPPKGAPPYYPSFVQFECPPWQCPNVWASPLEKVGEVCVPWCATDVAVLQVPIEKTRLAILLGVSYEIEQAAVNDGDLFTIRVLRNGQEYARWQDMVIDNAATDPANRYLFGGHLNPIPVTLRIDHDEHLTITFRYDGPINAPCTPADPFNGDVKIVTEGFLNLLRDTRQGAPKFTTSGGLSRNDSEPFNDRYLRKVEENYDQMMRRGV